MQMCKVYFRTKNTSKFKCILGPNFFGFAFCTGGEAAYPKVKFLDGTLQHFGNTLQGLKLYVDSQKARHKLSPLADLDTYSLLPSNGVSSCNYAAITSSHNIGKVTIY